MASPTVRAIRSRLVYAAIRVIGVVARRLPLRVAQAIGRSLGGLAFHVVRRERNRALRNIALAFPDWPAVTHQRTVKAMFRHLGSSLFEVLWLPNVDAKTIARTTIFEGVDPVVEAIKSGRAVVGFGAHCGNWEWLANALAIIGMPVTALQRERSEGGLNELILAIRAHSGVQTIDRGSDASPRALLKAMRQPNLVGFLIDQSIRAESVKVPFFGMPALTPIGPARLAVRTGTLVVHVFAQRRRGRHHIIFGPLTPPENDPIELTARMTRAIEEQIRQAPEQWVWMHDRWRDRPKWNIEGEQSDEQTQSS